MMTGLPYKLRDLRSLFQVSCYSGIGNGPRCVWETGLKPIALLCFLLLGVGQISPLAGVWVLRLDTGLARHIHSPASHPFPSSLLIPKVTQEATLLLFLLGQAPGLHLSQLWHASRAE